MIKKQMIIVGLFLSAFLSCKPSKDMNHTITYHGEPQEFLFIFKAFCVETYDSNFKKIRTECFKDGTKADLLGSIEFKYNNAGELLQIMQYSKSLSADTIKFESTDHQVFKCSNENVHRVFEYDNDGNLVKVDNGETADLYKNFKKFDYKSGELVKSLKYLADAEIEVEMKSYFDYKLKDGIWISRQYYSYTDEFDDDDYQSAAEILNTLPSEAEGVALMEERKLIQ